MVSQPWWCASHLTRIFARRSRSQLRIMFSLSTRITQEDRRTKLDVAVHAEQHVVGLDITVDDAVPVEVLETLGGLARDGGNLALGHQVGGDDVCQRAAFHVLHDNPELVLVQEGIYVVDDVGVSRSAHDKDLVDNEILLGLLVEVHLLDSHGEVCADLVCGVHATRCTEVMSDVMSDNSEWKVPLPSSDLHQVPVQLCRIRIRADLLQPLDDIRLLRDILLLLLPSPRSGAATRCSLLKTGSGRAGLRLRCGTPSLPLTITRAGRRLERQL